MLSLIKSRILINLYGYARGLLYFIKNCRGTNTPYVFLYTRMFHTS
ncbi:hypothetical protein [Candidatus Lariskella endosymbiont of Epinotia ramella]